MVCQFTTWEDRNKTGIFFLSESYTPGVCIDMEYNRQWTYQRPFNNIIVNSYVDSVNNIYIYFLLDLKDIIL